MKFRYRLLLPLPPGEEELGETNEEDFLRFVRSYDWNVMLKKSEHLLLDDVLNTLSIVVENIEDEQFFRITNTGGVNRHGFMIFFKRPVIKTYLWGLFRRFEKNFETFRRVKSKEEIERMIHLFFKGELEDIR